MSKSKKNLYLEKRLVRPSIIEFAKSKSEDYKIGEYTTKNKSIGHYNIKIEISKNDYDIDIYFKSNGTTTLTYSKHEGTIIEELADYIESVCKFSCVQSNYRLKDISEDDFVILLEYLVEEGQAQLITDTRTDEVNQSHFTKFKGPDFDEITIIRYKTGTMLVQGRPLYLFNILISMTATLDLGNLNELAKVEIDHEQVESELRTMLPNSYNRIGTRQKKELLVPLALQQYDIGMKDYTYITFNALRNLEGHLRKVLVENEIRLNGEFNINCFEECPNLGRYKFRGDISGNKFNVGEKEIIEKSYDYWNKTRHELFHQTDFFNNRIVETMQEAKEIVESVMLHIDNYYAIM